MKVISSKRPRGTAVVSFGDPVPVKVYLAKNTAPALGVFGKFLSTVHVHHTRIGYDYFNSEAACQVQHLAETTFNRLVRFGVLN